MQESLLPKYNPSAVFIFDINGNIKYKNEPATEQFKQINNFNDFNIKDFNIVINNNINGNFYYNHKQNYYQLDVIAVIEESSIFVYSTNVTSLVKLHSKIKDNEKVLLEQSKAAEMGHMIGVISHQLKQPLSVIKLLTQGMQLNSELGLDIDEKSTYPKIVKQVDFLTNTIDLFRNFLNTNQEKESIYLTKVIDDTLSVSIDAYTDIDIIKNYSDLKNKVSVLPNELIQVCMNIIKNARDIQDEKNIENKIIKISVYEEDEYQIISINDNAGGVPENIINKVFDQYFSTKSKKDGTGIGLNLAKRIIKENHNGKILIENKNFTYKGKDYFGACFYLKLKTNS